jgi:predicted CXXCH cytochrome family protein
MKKLLVVAVVLAIALVASVAMAGIKGSKHDLSNSGGSTQKAAATEQNDEVCVWCHTPHSANQNGDPLWNKSVPSTGYTAYGTTIAGNNILDAGLTNGTTKACLSCHDGVNALNSVINLAGGGGVVAAGQYATFNGVSGAVAMTNANFLIGTDLANDHPVGFLYSTSKGLLNAKLRTLDDTAGLVAKVTSATNVAGSIATARVECSSCHEPHGTAAGYPAFLRISNSESAVCFACHDI